MVPVIPILGGAAALGIGNLVLRLLGKRNSMLIGAHLLAGIGALSATVVILKGSTGDDGAPAGSFGNVAAGLLALGLFIALVRPLVAKDSRLISNALLAAHIACGAGGGLAVVLWASSL